MSLSRFHTDVCPVLAPANHGDRVLPMPAVLDSGAAVLLHLLLADAPERPVVLDASGLREIDAVGALLLAAALRTRSCEATVPRIINLAYDLRRELSRHPLLEFVSVDAAAPLFGPGATRVAAAVSR